MPCASKALLLAAVCSVAAVSGLQLKMQTTTRDEFARFKKEHAREYSSREEEALRFGHFTRNMARAAELQASNPLAVFGTNEFSDLSEAEFKRRHNAEAAFVGAATTKPTVHVPVQSLAGSQIDWRTKGAVTPVKNQGQCGSCWTFSTTGSVEAQWFLAGNPLVSLSEQELVSCGLEGPNGDDGCNGGLPSMAMSWLVSKKGGWITGEQNYPYVSGAGPAPTPPATFPPPPACDMSGKPNVAQITGHNSLPHSESAMATWMLTGGPISIGVDATSWQSYKGGIMTNCISKQVDHAVLAVGFDQSNSPPYWIIKNSWATSWGEQGYIRIEYGKDQCLITTAPTSAIAKGATPSPHSPPGPKPPGPSPSNSGSSDSATVDEDFEFVVPKRPTVALIGAAIAIVVLVVDVTRRLSANAACKPAVTPCVL